MHTIRHFAAVPERPGYHRPLDETRLRDLEITEASATARGYLVALSAPERWRGDDCTPGDELGRAEAATPWLALLGAARAALAYDVRAARAAAVQDAAEKAGLA